MSDERYQTFEEFWPFYVREHSLPACRALHFVGSTLALAAIGAAVAVSPWFWFAAPLIGYGFAWIGHFAIEKNRPASFHYPLWSFRADWKMWFLILIGRMPAEVRKAMAAGK